MNERKRFVAFLVALHGLVETVDAAPVRGQDIRGCEPSAAAAHASGLQSARDRRKGPTAVEGRARPFAKAPTVIVTIFGKL